MHLFRRGIDTHLFRPLGEHARSADQDRGSVLLYVGRVSSDKGLDFLIQVFTRLCWKRSDLRLIIVGEGPALKNLRTGTAGQRVVLTGKISHEALPGIYACADLFVFPSTTDTFGRAVLEAQACGLPAIVSNIGGPQEIVAHGRTGYIAKAGSYLDWTEKIEHLLEMKDASPETYRRICEEARARVISRFDNREILDSLIAPGPACQGDGEEKIA
jgi:glycosyltransferase involved in cell wall biosynthesis